MTKDMLVPLSPAPRTRTSRGAVPYSLKDALATTRLRGAGPDDGPLLLGAELFSSRPDDQEKEFRHALVQTGV